MIKLRNAFGNIFFFPIPKKVLFLNRSERIFSLLQTLHILFVVVLKLDCSHQGRRFVCEGGVGGSIGLVRKPRIPSLPVAQSWGCSGHRRIDVSQTF